MATAYTWRRGSRFKAAAQVAGEICEALERDMGLTPQNLVEVSTPESAPLHDEFEWDNQKAASLYRETQGRHLIASLVVVTPEPQVEDAQIRAFHNVTITRQDSGGETDRREYRSLGAILSTPSLEDQLLTNARRDARIFRDKYRRLSAAAPVISAMNQALLFDEPEEPEEEQNATKKAYILNVGKRSAYANA